MLLSSRLRFGLSIATLFFIAVVGVTFDAPDGSGASMYVGPAVVSLLVFGVFALLLLQRLGETVFGEVGFLYLGLTVAYTVLPAFAFMASGLADGAPLTSLLPDPTELRAHLWRQVLFQSSVAVGYFVFRGRRNTSAVLQADHPERDTRALLFVSILLIVCVASLILMSAPVASYYDHYVRYDHLSWLPRKFVSLAVRLTLGIYCVLLVLLFRNFPRYRFVIPLVVAAICVHETLYSYGARIQSLIVILQAVCLYHFGVKRISVRQGALACLAVGVLFSAVELVRSLEGDLSSARSAVSEDGLAPAAEFFAVFFSGFHLYAERAAGTLPVREWPMFFYDFLSLFTWGDMTRWNPMYWYAENYYPSAAVPPFTIGPIADSALWGGEIDLLFRGVLNGAFFAVLMRWFLRYRNRWWGVTIYVYCYATCILTLKYGVFYVLNPIVKNLLPTIVLVAVVRRIRFGVSRPVFSSTLSASLARIPPQE
jgi:hypothetical protein